MKDVVRHLDDARRRARRLLLVRRCSLLIAGLLVVAGIGVGCDWIIRFSSTPRFIFFGVLLIGIGLVLILSIMPAWRFRPSREQMALTLEGRQPDLEGYLASSIQFEESGLSESNHLAARSVDETRRRLEHVEVGSIIDPQPARKALALLVLVVFLVGAGIVWSPTFMETGFTRVLMPWSTMKWPSRTAVVSRMEEVLPDHRVHGKELPLLLRAENMTIGGEQDAVQAVFRTRENNALGDWQEIVLTHQRDGIHERLITVNGDSVELFFRTEDAQTDPESISLIPLPQINSARIVIQPPTYSQPWRTSRRIESDPGSQILPPLRPPALEGSEVTLELELNRQLPISDDADENWIRSRFGISSQEDVPQFSVHPNDNTIWQLTWTAGSARRLMISLEDEYGLESLDPLSVHVPTEPDRRPDVVLVDPEQDLEVTASARLDLTAEARDDLPLANIGIRVGEPGVEEQKMRDMIDTSQPQAQHSVTLDLADIGVSDGDVLEIAALARDRLIGEDGLPRETQSRPRTIRVISTPELLSQVRDQLGLLEQRAMDLDDRQEDIAETMAEAMRAAEASVADEASAAEAKETEDLIRAQADISRRIGNQQEMTAEVREWLENNRVQDERIEMVLDQVEEALEDGREASQRATSMMQRGESSEDPSDDQDAHQQARQTAESQREVRDALQDVVEALSDDQENWLLTRRLDQIESQQQDLMNRTRSMANRNRGRSVDDLSEQDRTELDQTVREQRGLEEAVEDLLEELEAQAQATDQVDPATAEAMEKVIEAARDNEVQQGMQDATDELQDGRMERASDAQQQVMEALQAMQEAMEPSERDELIDLMRRLVNAEQEIEILIGLQIREINRLDESIPTNSFDGLDRPMIDLRRRTLFVMDQLRGLSQTEQSIVQRLDRAGDEQRDAIGQLRSDPVDAMVARGHEVTAREQLESAIIDVRQEQAETKEDLARAERADLANNYRLLAEKQIGIQARTQLLVDTERQTRRTRHQARRLSPEQRSIGDGTQSIREDHAEIEQRPVFVLLHDRILKKVDQTEQALSTGQMDASTIRDQSRVARDLLAMAEALEEENGEGEEFQRAQGSSDSGGGSMGGDQMEQALPPIAELRLLRTLQFDVMEETRRVDRDPSLNEEERSIQTRALSDMQGKLAELGEEMFDRLTADENMQPDLVPPTTTPMFQSPPPRPEGAIESPPLQRPRSLDDLLGIEEDDQVPSTDPTILPDDYNPLEAVVDEMDRAASLLGDDLITGPQTQRLQQDILRRIDSLIDQARQQQAQSQSSSSQSQQQQSQQESQSQQQPSPEMESPEQRAAREAREAQRSQQATGDGDPSEREQDLQEASLSGRLDETNEEWGSLPQRIRELLRQGRRDSYSSVYEKLTGDYYRRLAEDQND